LNSTSSFPATDFTSVRVSVDQVLESDCRHIYELWDSLRGDRFAPSWDDFDLSRLPVNVIPYTRVVDVIDTPFDLKYRFWGTGLVTVLGYERTGKSLANLPGARNAETTAEYKTVIEEKAPYAHVYNAKAKELATPIYAPALRLPLSDNGRTVDKVIAYADFHADQDKWLGIFTDKLK